MMGGKAILSTNSAMPDNVRLTTRTAVSLEYASLRHAQHCPLGMYVVPSAENLLVWDAVLFIHQGALLVPIHDLSISK